MGAARRSSSCCAPIVLINVRLMLLSGIGKPYDPQSGQGVVGRNYCLSDHVGVQADLRRTRSSIRSSATGALGMIIDDYNGDNFDHGGLGFFGGGYMGVGTDRRAADPDRGRCRRARRDGAREWKKATAETYQRALQPRAHGSSYSYAECYLDLDPTYKDRFGRPLLRMTFDFHDNELKMSAYLTDRLAEIAKAMDPAEMTPSPRKGPYDSTSTRPPTTPAAP